MTKPRRSRRWATLEADTAAVLGGRRITEPWFLFHERPDVVKDLPDGGRLIVDTKAYQRNAACTLLESTKAKYCTAPDDTPCVVVKKPGQIGATAIVPLAFLAELLRREKS